MKLTKKYYWLNLWAGTKWKNHFEYEIAFFNFLKNDTDRIEIYDLIIFDFYLIFYWWSFKMEVVFKTSYKIDNSFFVIIFYYNCFVTGVGMP